MLTELLPEARIAVAHGQMHERDLEKVMRDFVAQRFNILLCTTIIETGIDVPTANTIIMHRADKFGLAQLHQLRGRVGRSHHQAYAYLLVHDVGALTKQAQRRLDAIQQMEELGSGFYLAMHDLEIRGAGEVLGDNQSGEMTEVGFQLYSDMLNEAVRAQGGQGAGPGGAAPPPPKSICTCLPCCPQTSAATCTNACPSTSAWPTAMPKTKSTTCRKN
jgi:transcription-repair coupling factor (superfamily II helicase)